MISGEADRVRVAEAVGTVMVAEAVETRMVERAGTKPNAMYRPQSGWRESIFAQLVWDACRLGFPVVVAEPGFHSLSQRSGCSASSSPESSVAAGGATATWHGRMPPALLEL